MTPDDPREPADVPLYFDNEVYAVVEPSRSHAVGVLYVYDTAPSGEHGTLYVTRSAFRRLTGRDAPR